MDRDANALLVEFVRGRDAPCPRCGYNLRDLPTPTCPECREPLRLLVGRAQPPSLVWLGLAIAPGLFSGIAAALLTTSFVYSAIVRGGRGGIDALVLSVLAFAVVSAGAAVGTVMRPRWFLGIGRRRQAEIAAAVWALHVGLFVVLALFG